MRILYVLILIVVIGVSGVIFYSVIGRILNREAGLIASTPGPTGPAGVGSLNQLTDVDLTSLTSGNTLVYSGTDWKNRTLATPSAGIYILGHGTSVGRAVTAGSWTNVMTSGTITSLSNNSNLPSPLWTVAGSTLVWTGSAHIFMATYSVTASSSVPTDTMRMGIAVNSITSPLDGSIANTNFQGASLITVSRTYPLLLNTNDAVTVLISASNTRSAFLFFIGQANITLTGSTSL